MAQNDLSLRHTDAARRHDKILFAQRQDLAAHKAVDLSPAEQTEDDHGDDDVGVAGEGGDADDDDECGHGVDDLHRALQDDVNHAAGVAGDGAGDNADREQDAGDDE